MYGIGQLCSKFIGFIYVNEDLSTIKVAYVDFWGKRKDIEVPAKDIAAFSEVSPSLTDKFYQKLITSSLPGSLKMSKKGYNILDKSKFDTVFPHNFW